MSSRLGGRAGETVPTPSARCSASRVWPKVVYRSLCRAARLNLLTASPLRAARQAMPETQTIEAAFFCASCGSNPTLLRGSPRSGATTSEGRRKGVPRVKVFLAWCMFAMLLPGTHVPRHWQIARIFSRSRLVQQDATTRPTTWKGVAGLASCDVGVFGPGIVKS